MEVNEIQKKKSCDTLWYGLVGMVVFGQREDLIILEIFPTQMILWINDQGHQIWSTKNGGLSETIQWRKQILVLSCC